MNKPKEFLPITILTNISVIAIIQVSLTDYIFESPEYIGIAFLLLCDVMFFTNRKVYKYLMSLTLIAGTLGLISFSNIKIEIGFSPVSIHFIPFLILLLHSYIYRNDIQRALSRWFTKTEEERDNEEDIAKINFKKKFDGLSVVQLENKLNQDLVPAAKAALLELIEERSTFQAAQNNESTKATRIQT